VVFGTVSADERTSLAAGAGADGHHPSHHHEGHVDEDVLSALATKDVTQEKLIAAVKARL
jgi:hypothetical protein